MNNKSIKIKYLNDTVSKLNKIAIGDWIDLCAADDYLLKCGDYALIHLGVAMELPSGYEAHIVPRSSCYKNFKIMQTNAMGIIDESYKGDNDWWYFPALAFEDTIIHKGDRICQFRIVEHQPSIEFIEVEELGNPDRGGHGSTGKN